MGRFDKARLVYLHIKETNDNLIESMRLLHNSGDKFQ